MSVDRKEIDLIIRAALQGGKTLDSVTKSITDIEKALDLQTAAAKRGEASIDDLKATLLSLQRAQDQLKDQAGLIGQFERLAKQVDASSEKSVKAAKAYADFKDKLDKAGTATEAQSNKLIKLAATSERWQASIGKQRADQEALAVTLRESGISVDNLASAEDRARQAAAQLGVTINRTQLAIASYSEDVKKARAAEQAIADEQTFQKKLTDAANLNKAGQYVLFWTNALNAAEASEKQLKINDALRKTADEAVAAARGFKTLGTATQALIQPQTNLRDVIAGIINPSEQARTTLAGVEAQVRKVQDAVSAIKGPMDDYREQVILLANAQKAIVGQASLLDSFSRQVASLRQARTEYVAARTNVLQYAEALRTSGGASTQLEGSLRSAQGTLAAAQRNLQAQITTTRELRDAMRSAGLATNDLAGTQARLTTVAQSSTNAMQGLTTAHQRYGESVTKSANSHDLFNSSGRTTLGTLQRIRGELLSLVAAYVGIQGSINIASSAIDAFKLRQATFNQLAVTVGNDINAIGAAYAYLHEQSLRIGLDFPKTSEQFGKFAAAAKLTGRSLNETKFIFERFAEVGTVLHLSGEQMQRVFIALQQMLSKGKIQAEELTGQLGDSLPGAFGHFQQALKDKFPDLQKAMKDGKVSASELITVAEHLRTVFADRLPTAMQSLQANQNRLNTAINDFKLLIADSGFADEFAKLVERLTTFFKSEDGQALARDLATKFGLVAKALALIVENAAIVKDILIAGVLIFGTKMAVGFGLALAALPAQLAAISAAAATTTLAVRALQATFFVLAAAISGWAIGSILREKFQVVRLIGISFVIGLEKLWTRLKFSTEIIWEEIPNIIQDAMARTVNVINSPIRLILQAFSAAARALGKNELADQIDKAFNAVTLATGRTGSASTKLRNQMKEELAAIQKIGADMVNEELNPGQTRPEKVIEETKKPPPSRDKVKIDEKAAERRAKLLEQLESELRTIEARIEKQESESLLHRLAALDVMYTTLLHKIRKFGGAEGKAMEAQLTKDIATLKIQETKKFNDSLIKEQTDLNHKLEALDAQIGKGDKTNLEARLKGVRDGHQKEFDEITKFRLRLFADERDTQPADLMTERLEGQILALQNIEKQKFFEDQINALLEERKAKLDVILVSEKTGLITATQAREASGKLIAETQPKIEAAVTAGLAYVEAMRESAVATGASTTALDTLKAKLIEARESAKGLRTELVSAAQINEMLAAGAGTAFSSMTDAIGKAVVGLGTWQDAILATRNAFIKFAADFLMQIGTMILKQAILNALQSSGGGSTGGLIAGAINAIVKHSGGVVSAGVGPHRTVAAELFANAKRYEQGGLPGLKRNEVAAILDKNEEVLSSSDPRNVLNGGGAASVRAGDVKIINAIDSASFLSEGLSTQAGTRAIVNFIRANRSEVKAILGS